MLARGAFRVGLGSQRALLLSRSLCTASPRVNSGDGRRDWKKWGMGATALGIGSLVAYTFLQDGNNANPKDALPIADLPSKVDYLLIGAGTASFSAFRSIKARDVRSKILLIGSEDQVPYMRPPLSKEMFYNSDPELKDTMKFEQWNGRQRSLVYEPEAFYIPVNKLEESSKGGISILKNTWVSAIDSDKQIAHLVDKDGKIGSVEYGKCLLATGASPKTLPELNNLPKFKVSTFKSFSDFNRIDSLIQRGKVSSIAVIGGGLLGTELSCAFGARSKIIDKNFKISQVVPEAGNMSLILPEHLSKWMTEKVKNEGVHVITGAKVKSASLHKNKVVLQLTDGSELIVDHVITSVGSEPNIQLAKSGQLEIVQGGFKVNSEFKAKKNIWAAGDVATFDDPQFGRRRIEHHDHAVTSGRIAGENMTGGSLVFSKQSMFWSDLGPDIGLEAVGLIDSQLPTHSVFLSKSSDGEDDFDRGVVFYLKDNIIVGVLLWNIFDQIAIARRVIREKREFKDLTEVGKLFRLVDNREEKAPESSSPSKSEVEEVKIIDKKESVVEMPVDSSEKISETIEKSSKETDEKLSDKNVDTTDELPKETVLESLEKDSEINEDPISETVVELPDKGLDITEETSKATSVDLMDKSSEIAEEPIKEIVVEVLDKGLGIAEESSKDSTVDLTDKTPKINENSYKETNSENLSLNITAETPKVE